MSENALICLIISVVSIQTTWNQQHSRTNGYYQINTCLPFCTYVCVFRRHVCISVYFLIFVYDFTGENLHCGFLCFGHGSLLGALCDLPYSIIRLTSVTMSLNYNRSSELNLHKSIIYCRKVIKTKALIQVEPHTGLQKKLTVSLICH